MELMLFVRRLHLALKPSSLEAMSLAPTWNPAWAQCSMQALLSVKKSIPAQVNIVLMVVAAAKDPAVMHRLVLSMVVLQDSVLRPI